MDRTIVKETPDSPPKLELYRGTLLTGDCFDIARSLTSESVDLIYADPPFFSGRTHSGTTGASFIDTWAGGLPEYVEWLVTRLHEMRRLLKPTGSIYVHLDWHAVHYIKVEMDKIFGYDNLVNEVIWSYRSGGGAKHHFGRKHDTLLFYAKQVGKHKFFPDAVRVPYDAIIAKSRKDDFNENGKVAPDVWDISRPPNHSKEWVGYPTQKPRAVLERVIKSVTEDSDVVADLFCGSGTTLVVAQELGREWVGCDISPEAIRTTSERIRSVALADAVAKSH